MSGFGNGSTRRWLPILIVASVFVLCGRPAFAENAHADIPADGAQSAPTAQPGQRFGFDYRPADLTTFQIDRFEMQLDGGAWVSVGIPSTIPSPGTLPDYAKYVVAIPALTPGRHAVVFRACNSVCGEGSVPFAFDLVAQPPAPLGVGIVGE